MTKKVQFFESDLISNLEVEVNDFLKIIDDYKFREVKYNHLLLNPSVIRYTAMVVYNEEEYDGPEKLDSLGPVGKNATVPGGYDHIDKEQGYVVRRPL